MSYEKRLSSLISKGYFPKELPPVFSTASFGECISNILDEWQTKKIFTKIPSGKVPGKKKKKRNSYGYRVESADLEIISMPKRVYERRNIHITHPIPQALLSYELSKNWKTVQKWLSRQTFSMDEIRISDNYYRSIKGINFSAHSAKKAYIESTSDWLVKTDISRFYPTIYTHSITWAAYGKEKVKRNINLYTGSLADRIDSLTRACNRNQTIGIPIGPESSRVISEIISSRIDELFKARISNIPTQGVDRLQDDWFIGTRSLENAETILSSVTSIYREFGLDINGHKTSIDRIIANSGTSWISEIGAFLSHKSGPIRGGRLKELLSICLRLQTENPNDRVINYALSIIESQRFGYRDVEYLESFLLKSAVISPISMDRICRIFVNLKNDTGKISKKTIYDRFKILAERNLENGNLYEVIWLIYTLRGLKIPLNSKVISTLSEITPSSSLALILLDMKSKGLFVGALPIDKWNSDINRESVKTDWMWLLGYEGIRHGWISDKTKVMDDDFFKAMASRNVVFYDPTKNVTRSTSVNKWRWLFRKQQRKETQKILNAIRNVQEEDY